MRKIFKYIAAGVLTLSCFGLIACNTNSTASSSVVDSSNNTSSVTNSGQVASSSNDSTTIETSGAQGTPDDTMFSSGDTKVIEEEDYDTEINLSELSSDYTISSPGTYHVTGSSTDHQLIINYDDTDEKNVHLVLDNVTMTNSLNACIYVKNAEKVIIHLVGTNVITSTYETKVTDGTSSIDGAIHSKDDLTITGDGELTVNSKLHGIVCKNDLKFTGGTIKVNSSKKALDVNDSLRIADADITLVSTGSDGIHLENDENDAFFYMESGSLNITSPNDGIDASTSTQAFTGYISIVGGTINITTGGGYTKTTSSSSSAKGTKSDNTITISGGTVIVNSSDDSIHAAGLITVKGGVLNLKTGDDGIHSDIKVVVNSGTITVNAHEGIEGKTLEINGGNITIVASDDGINASNAINVNGGYLDITMGNGDVDGVDSNGTFTQTGGFIIARVPGVNEMAAPLDTDSTVKITGGTFIALGAFNTANSSTSVPSVTFGSSQSSFGGGPRGFMGGGAQGESGSTVSFASGTYTVSLSSESDALLTFTLSQSYQNLTIVSDKLSTSSSYVLYKDGSSYKTWTQSSTSVTVS